MLHGGSDKRRTHLHGVMRLGAAEGLPCSEQDVHQHTQCPPVHTVVVPAAQHCMVKGGRQAKHMWESAYRASVCATELTLCNQQHVG